MPAVKPSALICLALAAACALPAAAREPGAHVHGAARLLVAVDGATLSLALESPLDSLIDFEHMPRTEREKSAVRTMAERLNKPGELFLPTPAARCAPVSVKLESPLLAAAGKSDGHADLDGEFVFRCERPDALREIDVRLFAVFPHLRRLDVEVASPRGQSASRLAPQQTRVTW